MSSEQPTILDKTAEKERYLQAVSHVRMGLAPTNLDEGFRLAEVLAKSTLVPKDFQGNPGNCLIAIQMGIEVGLAPMQALQSIAVINGRPSMWGDGLLAIVMAAPVFEWIDEPPVQDGIATCTVKRRGWPHPVVRTFSMEDAKKANLLGKSGPWQQYPDRMLRMRARSFALRDVFADVLRGLSSAEEQMDVSEPARPAMPTIQPPQRKAASTSPAPPPPVAPPDPAQAPDQVESFTEAVDEGPDDNAALDAELARADAPAALPAVVQRSTAGHPTFGPVKIYSIRPRQAKAANGKLSMVFTVTADGGRTFDLVDTAVATELGKAREQKTAVVLVLSDNGQEIRSCVMPSMV